MFCCYKISKSFYYCANSITRGIFVFQNILYIEILLVQLTKPFSLNVHGILLLVHKIYLMCALPYDSSTFGCAWYGLLLLSIAIIRNMIHEILRNYNMRKRQLFSRKRMLKMCHAILFKLYFQSFENFNQFLSIIIFIFVIAYVLCSYVRFKNIASLV